LPSEGDARRVLVIEDDPYTESSWSLPANGRLSV